MAMEDRIQQCNILLTGMRDVFTQSAHQCFQLSLEKQIQLIRPPLDFVKGLTATIKIVSHFFIRIC